MVTALCVLSGLFAILSIAAALFAIQQGNTNLILKTGERTPFKVEARDEDSVTLVSTMDFVNKGKQCATVTDCLARTQLPYEQYDGIEVWGKVERAGAPRDDDYFEATLVPCGQMFSIRVIVRLTARHGRDIKTALRRMVDVPIDIIYTRLGRRPWVLKKTRIVLTAEEIAGATGVELAED